MEQGLESEIVQETRLFDEGKQVTYPMRTKEGLADYRYFPEPDLPAVDISPAFLQQVKVRCPFWRLSRSRSFCSHIVCKPRDPDTERCLSCQ